MLVLSLTSPVGNVVCPCEEFDDRECAFSEVKEILQQCRSGDKVEITFVSMRVDEYVEKCRGMFGGG